eukprot:901568_1
MIGMDNVMGISKQSYKAHASNPLERQDHPHVLILTHAKGTVNGDVYSELKDTHAQLHICHIILRSKGTNKVDTQAKIRKECDPSRINDGLCCYMPIYGGTLGDRLIYRADTDRYCNTWQKLLSNGAAKPVVMQRNGR